MKNLTNPKWLLIFNTLPIIALFALFYGEFKIIKSLLTDTSIRYWIIFGIVLFILGASSLAYSIYCILKKLRVSFIYALVSLLCYTAYIYLYYSNSWHLIPFEIPAWISDTGTFFYIGTFLMPSIAYSVLILVFTLTSENKQHKAWVNFLIALSIPLTGYLFSQLALPLWRRLSLVYENAFFAHAFIIFIIAITLVFFFFLARGIYIIALKKTDALKKYQLAWKIPIVLIIPMIGLFVNNGVLGLIGFTNDNSGMFGNFHNLWFYILTVLNAIFLCLPNLDNKNYRIILFAGRCITLTFSLYFFLVFLPFLPFSVVAIIIFGTGFLLLAPLFLFIIHVKNIHKDYLFLKNIFSRDIVNFILILGFTVIPVCITASFIKDKSVLFKTLEYVYAPDYSKQYKIDKNSLYKTLRVTEGHGARNNIIYSSHIPYISSYFNWLVLNNLTLTDAKINDINRIFFNTSHAPNRTNAIGSFNVEITKISANSEYDYIGKFWKSWVDLELTNKSRTFNLAEYETIINLPQGCFISDYYLYVEGVKEYGILSEKRTAMWVYSNIRNRNEDPGILHYLTGNNVSFRVFPFTENETRKTGIEFIHRDPVTLLIDGKTIELGIEDEDTLSHLKTINNDFVFFTPEGKKSLNVVQRKPYFHFLVDTSAYKNKDIEDLSQRIEKTMESNKELCENAKISFVNSYVNTFSLDENWKHNFKAQKFEGGFYLERGISIALYNAHKNQAYPVIVAVTNNIRNAFLETDFSNLKFTFPESDLYFCLFDNGSLMPFSLMTDPKIQLPLEPNYSFNKTVLEYITEDNKKVYLPDNNESSIALINNNINADNNNIEEKDWFSALALQAMYMSHTLHPNKANKEYIKMISHSFRSKIMTPLTSYIVVENEAQKAILLKKQQEVLAGSKLLDLDDTTIRMSEPGLWVLLLCFAVWLIKHRQRWIKKRNFS